MTLEFGPLPPRKPSGGRPEAPWRAALRARPGEWAVVQRVAGVPSGKSLVGGYTKIPGYEFAQRRQPDGSVWIYARYVGATP